MKWTREAEEAISRVPFFVRKKVRARVEKEARESGRHAVGLADVRLARKRYVSDMSSEIKGYRLDACFGQGGCPNRALESGSLVKKLEETLEKAQLLTFLTETVDGSLRHHHEFSVSIADCPNGCSQPQIKDIGIIGAVMPVVTEEECNGCNQCMVVCREKAVSYDDDRDVRTIDYEKCVLCGQCAEVCPTETIVRGEEVGYRVQLGGKLGRHPVLARELPGIFEEDEVVDIVSCCLDFYKNNSAGGVRFGELLTSGVFEKLWDDIRSRRV